MKIIRYPRGCRTPTSKLSYLYKFLKICIAWINDRGEGIDNEAFLKRKAIFDAINYNRKLAIKENYHGMTGLIDGKVVLPSTAKHGGAKVACLFVVSSNYKNALGDNEDFQIKMGEAIAEAENDTKWNPTMEDIIDG